MYARYIQDKYGPICLVTIGAHSDTNDIMMGEKIAHGTPFRRAIEEGCVDGARSIQIGLRGTGNTPFDYKWVQDQVCMCVCVCVYLPVLHTTDNVMEIR